MPRVDQRSINSIKSILTPARTVKSFDWSALGKVTSGVFGSTIFFTGLYSFAPCQSIDVERFFPFFIPFWLIAPICQAKLLLKIFIKYNSVKYNFAESSSCFAENERQTFKNRRRKEPDRAENYCS